MVCVYCRMKPKYHDAYGKIIERGDEVVFYDTRRSAHYVIIELYTNSTGKRARIGVLDHLYVTSDALCDRLKLVVIEDPVEFVDKCLPV